MIKTDLETLAHPGGRLPGTTGHDNAASYLLERMTELSLAPYAHLPSYEHNFDAGDGIEGRNLIGVIPGRDSTLAPLLIGAHYDSVIAAACADDNASAVATMLSVAARIAPGDLARDLIVAAFDTEEPPRFLSDAMGSARFVEDVLVAPVHMAVIMDLVGHRISLGQLNIDPHLIFALGAESHPGLPPLLQGLDMPIVPTRNDRIGDLSDHHAFRLAGMPFLFFSCGEWPGYHRPDDTLDGVDTSKLERLADALTALLRGADAARLGAATDHDITPIEIEALTRELGTAGMALAAALIGVDRINERSHLDRLVPALRRIAQQGLAQA